MYLFVVFQEKESYYRDGPNGKTKARIEETSGERCMTVPYQEFDMHVIEEFRPRAIARVRSTGRSSTPKPTRPRSSTAAHCFRISRASSTSSGISSTPGKGECP